MIQTAKKKRTIKIIGLSLMGFVLIFSIVSMIVVAIIYNGQFPRHDKPDYSVTAALPFKDIETDYSRSLVNFQSGKNRLQGYVYGSDQEQGLVVVAHGLGGGADSYLPQITYFVDQGWRVFAYDATGSFSSEGKTTRGFPQALIDLDAALAYINSQDQFADLPILLFGHSWGGYAVANLLHYDYDIAGVASISGANSPMEMIVEQGRSMMGCFIDIQYPYLWFYQKVLFGETASLKAADAINKSDVPILIIHGTEDESVGYEGSSIISHMGDISRHGVKAISISESGRNGHYNLLRSIESMEYIDKINIEYRTLYDSYEKNIPYEIKRDFYSKIDRSLAQEINRDLMDEINAFFMESLKK